MAVTGNEPVSAANLAAVMEVVGGAGQLETLWTGSSYRASVPGVSECSVIYVALGGDLTSVVSCIVTLLPNLSNRTLFSTGADRMGAEVTGDIVEAIGTAQVGNIVIRGVYGIRSGGGQLLADALSRLLREVG